jgi:nitrile hydratase accessory protein
VTTTVELDIEGPAAPPRSNGELVFAEPWEGRAFGLTMALVDAGTLEYESFRTALIERIGAAGSDAFSYYRCWLQALEQVVEGEGLVSPDDLGARAAQFAARPAGHDHRHDHPHDHG